MGTSRSEREDVVNVLGLATSEGQMGTVPSDAITKEPSRGIEILDVEEISEGGFEGDEERKSRFGRRGRSRERRRLGCKGDRT